MAKLRLEPLDKEELLQIHYASLRILGKVGVLVEHDEALKMLKDLGAEVNSKRIVKIPEHLVKETLKKTPSTFTLYGRDSKHKVLFEPWRTYFDVGSSGRYYMDWKTGEVRVARSEDLAIIARVSDALEHTHLVSTSVIPSDAPEVIADRYRMYIVAKNSSKPIDTGVFTIEGVPDAVKIMAAVIGEENVSKKPYMIFAACPSPPLKWSKLTVQTLIDCAKYRIPAHIIPMPQTALTAPPTIAGALVQANAEFLVGVVIAQFTRPGAPLVYSDSPNVFDLRYASLSLSNVEVALISASFAQLARFYGLPSGSYVMVSDAKVVDAQAFLETAIGASIATYAGLNTAIGNGMLLEENCISPIKIVVDDEISGMVLRAFRGIEVTDETLVEEMIENVGPGGNYLRQKKIKNLYLRDHYLPKILDRETWSSWKARGSKDLITRAREKVEEILKKHEPEPLPPDVEKDLDKTFLEIMRRYSLEQQKLPLGPNV